MKKRMFFLVICIILCFSSAAISYATEDPTTNNDNDSVTTDEDGFSSSEKNTIETEGTIDSQLSDTIDISKMLSLKVEKIKVPFDADNLSGDVNAISYKTAINLNGDESMLYPTFDNKSTAIDNIKDQCSLVIGEMQDIYGLEKFSTSTWEDYYNIMHEYEENIFEAQNNDSISDEQDTKSQQIIKLRGFFDIYENYDTNDSILSEISKINMVKLDSATNLNDDIASKVEQIEDLSLIMPSNTGWETCVSDLSVQISAVTNDTTSTPEISKHPNNGKFSITKGVKWADDYATKPNKSKYGYKSSDCTNFVSQIKHEGGVPYYLTGNVSKGWSHWLEYHAQVAQHAYSTKWVRADSFTKFFGVKQKFKTESYSKKRTAFIKFAAAVKKGTFIAYDEEGDGDWNHNAFVSHTYHSGEDKRRSIDYHGSTYKDFKIAQHTKNYNAWVSGAKCGWEDLPYNHDSVIFAIVN